MITNNKSKQINPAAQIVAGLLPSDPHIEFVGLHQTKTIIWLQHGAAHRFEDLSNKNYLIVQKYYLTDKGAIQYFHRYREQGLPISFRRKVELYIYYMCGELDSTPDLVDGVLNFSENFRESKNCPSLKFDKKFITIGGVRLTSREIRMIDFMKEDLPDKAIAASLQNRDGSTGITESTYNFHRHNLYQKVGVQTKTALLQKANEERI